MKTVGVIPVKRFSRAKSRLVGVLRDGERVELARSFFLHVLSVAQESGVLDEIVVATDGDDVAALAHAHGVTVLRDPPSGSRLGEVVEVAIGHVARSADAVLVLMGDLPHLDVADVRTIVALLADADVVLAPDLREEGTNALAMRTRPSMHTAFGHGDSFARHRVLHASARVTVHASDGLGFDVDTERDWRRFRGFRDESAPARRA